MKNWKTTLVGLLGGIGMLANTLVANHQALTVGNILPGIAVMLLGLFAKDNNVTGGTVVQSSTPTA